MTWWQFVLAAFAGGAVGSALAGALIHAMMHRRARADARWQTLAAAQRERVAVLRRQPPRPCTHTQPCTIPTCMGLGTLHVDIPTGTDLR